MQDRKALQAGTSHFLGQNFSKAAEIIYQSREGGQEFAWTTSWGVSTRLIGGMIMVHGDDDGMIMPPRLAPNHVAVLPIIRKDEERDAVLAYCEEVAAGLRQMRYDGSPLRVIVDKRDINAGEKGWEWVKKGIPLTVEVGPRDMAEDSVFVGRRDKSRKERYGQKRNEFIDAAAQILEEIQDNLLARAKDFMAQNTRDIDTWEEFSAFFTVVDSDKSGIHGGFASGALVRRRDLRDQDR